MGRLERHIDREALARALNYIATGERPTPTLPRRRMKPRKAESYRAAWRNAGSRANMPTLQRPVQPRGRCYPYNSVKRGWGA